MGLTVNELRQLNINKKLLENFNDDDEIEITEKDLKNNEKKANFIQALNLHSQGKTKDLPRLNKFIKIADQAHKISNIKLNELWGLSDAKYDQQRENLLEILANLPKDKKINHNEFNTILEGVKDLNTAEQIKGYSQCVNAMLNSNIPLIKEGWFGFGNSNNLSKLSKIKAENLEGVGLIFTYLNNNKALSGSSNWGADENFDYIINHSDQFTKAKAQDLITALKYMKSTGIPIQGNAQRIMGKVDKLAELNSALGMLVKETKGKIKPLEFELLLNADLTGKQEYLQTCFDALNKNKIPLVNDDAGKVATPEIMGGDPMGQLVKKSPKELEGISKILASLGTNIGTRQQKDTFNYILNNSNSLKDKAGEIADVFNALRTHSISAVGVRNPIMTMNKGNLTKLNEVISNLPKGIKLDTAEIKALIKDIPNWDPAKAEAIGKCVVALKNAKYSLTTMNPFGEHRLNQLAKLTDKQLGAVEKILTSLKGQEGQVAHLGGTITDLFKNEDLLDYLLKDQNINVLTGTADQVVKVFDAMRDTVSLTGHRRQIMDIKNPKHLENLATVLNAMKPFIGSKLNDDEFKALINHSEGLRDETQAKHLGESIRILRRNKISLTTLNPFGEDRLTQLVKLPANELEAVQKLLSSLDGGKDKTYLDGTISDLFMGDAFDDLMKNRETLGKNLEPEEFKKDEKGVNVNLTKADRIDEVFSEMRKAGISLAEHRREIMESHPEDLQRLLIVLEGINSVPRKDKEKPALDKQGFKELLYHSRNTKLTREQAIALGQSIIAISNNELSLTNPFITNKLSELMANHSNLPGIAKVLTSLAGKGNEQSHLNDDLHLSANFNIFDLADKDTFGFLMKHGPELNEEVLAIDSNGKVFTSLDGSGNKIVMTATKADSVTVVFDLMRKANISLSDHAYQIIGLKPATLANLALLLSAFNKSDEKLDKKEFDALLKKAENLRDEKQATDLGTCISIMHHHKLPLTNTFSEDRLSKLANFDEGQLEAVTTVLMSLDEVKITENKTLPSYLDGSISDFYKGDVVDYLITNADQLKTPLTLDELTEEELTLEKEAFSEENGFSKDTLSDEEFKNLLQQAINEGNYVPSITKADRINDLFNELRELGIPLTGARRQIMDMDAKTLKGLYEVMQAFNSSQPKVAMNQDSFKTIIDHIGQINDMSQEQKNDFIQCIQALEERKIGLAGSFFSKDKVEQLAKLNPEELAAAAKILSCLAKHRALDARTFDNVMGSLKHIVQQGTADQVVQSFKSIGDRNNKALIGSRKPIMELSKSGIEGFVQSMSINNFKLIKNSDDIKSVILGIKEGNKENKTLITNPK